MAFKQYTKCTLPNDFKPFSDTLQLVLSISGMLLLIAGIVTAALVPIAGPIMILAGGGILLAPIISTFNYLLGGKLICLGGDKLAIGKVLSVETATSKNGIDAMDNDYSVNILLCPHEMINGNIDDDWRNEDIPFSDPLNTINYQDHLVQEQEGSRQNNLTFTGYSTETALNRVKFHIELEGSRIYDMYTAFLIIWAILVAAALAATLVAAIPVIGWLIALLFMLIGAGFSLGVGLIAWDNSKNGDLDDLDPTIGELHKGDYIVTFGTWVYDDGHSGWNELHPVKFLSKADHCADEKEAAEWEDKIKETFDKNIIDKQIDLKIHSWEIHPLIDGCKPRIIII